jgi:Protein of unknown function (DUF2795)
MVESNRQDKTDQIPKEDDTQGPTGKVISDQNAIEGLRKEVVVESYSMVANIGQILKDLEFPADKNKIISFVENNASVGTQREEMISALKKIEEKSYKNVSEVTSAAGLVY